MYPVHSHWGRGGGVIAASCMQGVVVLQQLEAELFHIGHFPHSPIFLFPTFFYYFSPCSVLFVTLFVLVLALYVWRVGCWSSGRSLKVLGVGRLGLLVRFTGSHGVSLRGSLTEEGSVSAVPPRMLGPCGFGCLDRDGSIWLRLYGPQ